MHFMVTANSLLMQKTMTIKPLIVSLLVLLQVQFQKLQQLRLSQNRAQYYGGSLPNVNQIGNASTDFQVNGLYCSTYPSQRSRARCFY